MVEGFVNPALVAGTALAAVPLLIHLLNRRRYRPMPWAAMRFVLAAYRKTRRRVRFENLLLLLLRMGAVALLALAVARPFASGGGALGPLTERRRDVVLILDSSASTGYREEVSTIHERIVQRAGKIAGELDGGRGDRLFLISAGARPRLYGWQAPQKALSLLATLNRPTDEPLDLGAALGEVIALVEEDAAGTDQSTLELRLLTDLQRQVFAALLGTESSGDGEVEAPEARTPPLAEALARIGEYGLELIVEDLGPTPTRPPNLAIVGLGPTEGLLAPGAPVEIAVTLANHGESPRPAERVALAVDGNRLPVRRVDVPAGGTGEVLFSVELGESGPHTLEAELDGDRLSIDDRRAGVVLAPPPVRVLVINGAPADDIEEDEVGYLMLALEPLPLGEGSVRSGITPFDARERTVDALASADLDLRQVDVVVLANVPVVPDRALAMLEEWVAAGGSLVVALGSRVADLTSVNRRMFRPDGSGLLPAELLRRVSVARRESYFSVSEFDSEHPALSVFADEAWKPFLTEVPVYEFVAARPVADARVLAFLDDEERSPLLIERSFDLGEVFLLTSSFAPAWSDLPRSPRTLIPLVHEWLRYAGARHELGREIEAGRSLSLLLRGFPRAPALRRPDQSLKALDGEPEELADGRWRLPPIPGEETERVGLYAVDLEGVPSEPFAVQLDPGESDLTRLAPSEIAELHPTLRCVQPGSAGPGEGYDAPRRGEIWRLLAFLALAALVGESLWGAWLGSRRRIRS